MNKWASRNMEIVTTVQSFNGTKDVCVLMYKNCQEYNGTCGILTLHISIQDWNILMASPILIHLCVLWQVK